jgi:hypothetical protein
MRIPISGTLTLGPSTVFAPGRSLAEDLELERDHVQLLKAPHDGQRNGCVMEFPQFIVV